MRVLALTTWCPYPMVNGSAIRQYYLVRALAARHDVDLVTFSAPNAPTSADLAHLRSFCASVSVIPRSPFAPGPGGRSTYLSRTPRSFLQTFDPTLPHVLRAQAEHADVAVAFQLSAARYLTDAPVPVVFDEAEPRQIRNQIAEAWSLVRKARTTLTWWKHARFLKAVAAPMAAVTVVSDQEGQVLAHTGVEAARIHVIPNGADPSDLERSNTPVEPPRVIYPGAITYAPNLAAVAWFLEHVLPRLRAVRPDIQFWVTGDTGDIAIDRLPNHRWATFTGRLPDVKDAVGGAAVCVVPLLTGGGTRLKVLEAMAIGTPVVSTTKGIEGLEIVSGEHLLVADTPSDFADGVLRVLADGALATRLSLNARARVRSHYTWDAIGQRFLDVVAHAARAKERN